MKISFLVQEYFEKTNIILHIHSNSLFSQREFGRELFEKLGWVLSNPFVQAFVLIATAVLVGVSVFIFSISKFCLFFCFGITKCYPVSFSATLRVPKIMFSLHCVILYL